MNRFMIIKLLKSNTFLIGILSLVTFVTRVINIKVIPIFTDEAIYIRWAQIGLQDPAQRYISLTDGKQPLFTWLMYPLLKVFEDPLIAGRLVSVFAGVGTMLGLYYVVKTMFSNKTAIFTALIYIFSPFTFVYDRLALMDSLLAFFVIWSLYFQIKLIREMKFVWVLLFGITIGFGLLTKSSAAFGLYLIPFGILLFKRNNFKISILFKWVMYSVIASIIAELMFNSLRLSPWFYIIKQKNYSFIYTIPEFLNHPFEFFIPNLTGLVQMLFGYLTIPISALIFARLIQGFIRKDANVIYIFVWFLFPFLSLAAFGKIFFPRFILFMTIPLFILAADAMRELLVIVKKSWLVSLFVTFLILLYPAVQVVLLMTVPVSAVIPDTDTRQLLTDWPSGYGVSDVVEFLKEQAKYGKVVIGTEGTFGLFPAVFEIYLQQNPNVEIHGFWPVGKVPDELLKSSETYPTYLVFKEKQEIPSDWPLKLIAKYRRGNGNTYLLFYQVISKSI